MKRRTFFQLLAIISLSACQPIGLSTSTPGPGSAGDLPDLVVASVYLGMQGIPGSSSNCVAAYAPYEIRAVIENRGLAPAADVLLVEQSTGHQIQVGALQASQRLEVQIPFGSASGSYVVVADPQNTVLESNENNNVFSFLTPTPTPPAICPPATPTAIPTLLPATPFPLSLEGLIYADMSLGQIWKVPPQGQPFQVLNEMTAQFSPAGLQALFESAGDLWLAEPMDNPGVNRTNTPDRYEQFPQWWASNPGKVVFNSMGSSEAQEKNWNHDISGYLSMMNSDGSEYSTLSDVPSYTRPALSPDGKTIAYDGLGAPMLYETSTGARPFEAALYGYQPEIANAAFTSPSFSPDGRWLTWWISEDVSQPRGHFSLVMFDLHGNTSTTLHSYTLLTETPGWLDAPLWSPGGQWIAFQTRGEATARDLWVMHSEGGIGQRFDQATNPVWSPDNQRLAYVQWPPDSDASLPAQLSIIEVPFWNVQQTGLPAGAIPLAWIMTALP